MHWLNPRIPLPKLPPATPVTPRAPVRTRLSLLQVPSLLPPTMPPASVWNPNCLAPSALPLELTPLLSALSTDSFWGQLADCSRRAVETAMISLATARPGLMAASLSVMPVGGHFQVQLLRFYAHLLFFDSREVVVRHELVLSIPEPQLRSMRFWWKRSLELWRSDRGPCFCRSIMHFKPKCHICTRIPEFRKRKSNQYRSQRKQRGLWFPDGLDSEPRASDGHQCNWCPLDPVRLMDMSHLADLLD